MHELSIAVSLLESICDQLPRLGPVTVRAVRVRIGSLSELDWLFIENVGNLVCPASYDRGEQLRVVLLSVTEGEDKPLKYPTMFNTADLAIVTKIDLAAAVDA
jgi:hydrogenase accessory protein HypB